MFIIQAHEYKPFYKKTFCFMHVTTKVILEEIIVLPLKSVEVTRLCEMFGFKLLCCFIMNRADKRQCYFFVYSH